MIKRIKRTSVGEAVIAEIRDAITRGDLSPGDQLPPERELAERLGVSRLTMREGLKVLAAIGLVEARQGEGTFVCRPKAESMLDPLLATMLETEQLLELIEARTVLEVALVGLAARRASAAHLDRLAASLERFAGHLEAREDYLQADLDFHATIAEAADNPVLSRFYANINDLISHLRQKTYTVEGSGERALISHQEIFEAVCARKEAASQNAMREHMKNVQFDLEQIIKRSALKERE